MARCTGCSREIQDHAAFCPYCGTQNRSGTPAKDVPPKTEPPKEAKPFDKPKPKKGEQSFDKPKPTKDKKPIDRQKPQKEELPDKAAKTPKKKPLADKVQSAREKKSRPAKEKIPKPVKAAKTGGSPRLSNRMKVVIIIAVTVVLVTAIITTGIVLTLRKTTFDFTTVQYTEQINKAAGEQLLDKETWKINGAFAVYEGDGFSVTTETDADSQLVKEICITPPDHPVAERIVTYTVTVTKKTYIQQNNYIIFVPNPDDVHEEDLKKVPKKTDLPVTEPTEAPSTAVVSEPISEAVQTGFTGEELIEKSFDEIISLMDGDFDCKSDEDGYGSLRSGFGSSGVVWIYNESRLPGFSFHPDVFMSIRDDINQIKSDIRNGKFAYKGLSVRGGAKYNDAISADMTYNQLTQHFGYFDVVCAAQGTFSYTTELDGNKVSFIFEESEEMFTSAKQYKNNIPGSEMQHLNPKLDSIEIRKTAGSSAEDQVYHNKDYGWRVRIPAEWYQYGVVKESENMSVNYLGAVSFYYKEAYGTRYGGHVFTIYAMPNNSANDDGMTGGMPSGGFLGRNKQYAFYWYKATDVQYDYKSSEKSRFATEYRVLSDMRETILNTFAIDSE